MMPYPPLINFTPPRSPLPFSTAARVGVSLGPTDYMGAAAAGMLLSARMAAYEVAAHVPVLRDAADRSLVHKLGKQLASYGHAEFTTNADTYRPADAPAHPTTHA